MARAPGLVRAPRRPVRGARARRRRDGALHPEGAAAATVRRKPPRRGGPDPRAHRGHRDDAAPLARDAHRARPEPVARRLVAGLRRALRHLRRGHHDRGARACLRVGARADHPGLPRLPPALEAPPHRDRRVQRLLRTHTRPRAPRADRLRGRGRGSAPVRRRHGRRSHLEADARRDVLHGVRPLSGRLPRVRDREGAFAEAPDHGDPRPALRRGKRAPRRRRSAGPRAERGHGRRRLGLRHLRRVRPRVPGLDRARRPHRRPQAPPRHGRVAAARGHRDDAARRRARLESLGEAADGAGGVGGRARRPRPRAGRPGPGGPLLGRLRRGLRRAGADGGDLHDEAPRRGRPGRRDPGPARVVHRRSRAAGRERVRLPVVRGGERVDAERRRA